MTILGGFLGQLMIVLNTIAKHFPQYDRQLKSHRSNVRDSRPKSQASQKSDNKSKKSGVSGDQSTGEAPRMIMNQDIIQSFIYLYILEKLKTEKMVMQVDGAYEAFLKSLPTPLALNEMRTIKPEKYEVLRKILSNYTGSPVLRLIKENQEKLGLDQDIFDLVYEGFFDLYTFHPQCSDVSARKL